MTTVLVVEDTPSEMALITSFLKDSGYNVIAATDAKEALEKVTQYKPDVVVTDVVMPGMSGFELCRSLKKIRKQKSSLLLSARRKTKS